MEGKYGMVHTMTRTYRNYMAAVAAGVRRAKSTKQPAYIGMLLDLKFHVTDENPRGDWRWHGCTVCLPNGTSHIQH
jgi:hypothetical protein